MTSDQYTKVLISVVIATAVVFVIHCVTQTIKDNKRIESESAILVEDIKEIRDAQKD
jgi:hypothetical protein